MAKAIFTVFFNVIKSLASVILAPVNLLISNLFPDFTELINTFNSAVQLYLGDRLSFFFYILPPHARSLILIYLSILVSYYTISLTIHTILKVYKLIKNIKIW